MARSGAGIELLVQGVERVTLVRLEQTEPYLRAIVRPLPLPDDQGTEVEALRRAVLELTARALELAHPEGGFNIEQLAAQAPDPLILVFLVGSMLSLDVPKEQTLLEAPTRVEALRLLHGYLAHELQVLELRSKITSQAQNEMGKEQKEYLLRQQLRAIQGELGETDSRDGPKSQELRNRLIDADLPEDVHKEFERELGRMERLPAAAPDYQITRTYLELVLELPWRKSTEDDLDLEQGAAGARRRSLRSRKDQGADSRAPGGLEAQPAGQGADPVLRRAAGRGQDVAGPIDRPVAGPQVRTHEPGRPARRVRASRPSAHVHRRHARPHHPGDPPRRRQ